MIRCRRRLALSKITATLSLKANVLVNGGLLRKMDVARRIQPVRSTLSYASIRTTCPGRTVAIAVKLAGTRGSRSSSALLEAQSTSTPRRRFEMFCWNSRFWSPVTNTENSAPSALVSNAPFLRPAHDSCWTVRTSWPTKYRASCRGSCSSSRMRTSTQGFVSRFQRRDRLLSRDTRKRIEKFLKTVVSFEVVDQVAERHARPEKHGRAAQNIRIAVNNRRGVWHVGPLFADSSSPPALRHNVLFCGGP